MRRRTIAKALALAMGLIFVALNPSMDFSRAAEPAPGQASASVVGFTPDRTPDPDCQKPEACLFGTWVAGDLVFKFTPTQLFIGRLSNGQVAYQPPQAVFYRQNILYVYVSTSKGYSGPDVLLAQIDQKRTYVAVHMFPSWIKPTPSFERGERYLGFRTLASALAPKPPPTRSKNPYGITRCSTQVNWGEVGAVGAEAVLVNGSIYRGEVSYQLSGRLVRGPGIAQYNDASDKVGMRVSYGTVQTSEVQGADVVTKWRVEPGARLYFTYPDNYPSDRLIIKHRIGAWERTYLQTERNSALDIESHYFTDRVITTHDTVIDARERLLIDNALSSNSVASVTATDESTGRLVFSSIIQIPKQIPTLEQRGVLLAKAMVQTQHPDTCDGLDLPSIRTQKNILPRPPLLSEGTPPSE